MSFTSALLKKLIIHYTGSKNNLDPLHLYAEETALDEEAVQLIGAGLFSKFKSVFDYYSFSHPSSLQYNEVYNYVSEVFEDKDTFISASVKIAQHLYNSSTHPKVKGGELYVVLFEGLPVEGRVHSAIGLFKAEHKTAFIDVIQQDGSFTVKLREGIEAGKLDKGCLIINTKKSEGYDVLIFDNQNRGEEAAYWKETFLGLAPQKTEFHQTNHVLTLARQFINGQVESEDGLSKTEGIELLHKSIDYFKTKEAFDIEEFQQDVFAGADMVDGFRNFGARYVEQHDVDIASGFPISAQAVKKQMKIYKSVLKLDKNFHVYIHGAADMIEKGVDEDGRKYYKL
jgi:hypothetical protein